MDDNSTFYKSVLKTRALQSFQNLLKRWLLFKTLSVDKGSFPEILNISGVDKKLSEHLTRTLGMD